MAPYRPTPTVVICLLLHAVAVLGVVLMPAHWAGWLALLALAGWARENAMMERIPTSLRSSE